MQKNRKSLVAVLAVILVAVIAIGGTLAYLTDSQFVKNKFSGDFRFDVALEEPEWEEPEEVYPGDTFAKDPTVEAVSGDSYMRLIVNIRDTATGAIITDAERLGLILDTLYYNPSPVLEFDGVKDGVPAYGTKMTLAAAKAAWTQMNFVDFVQDTARQDLDKDQQFVYNYKTNGGKFVGPEFDNDGKEIPGTGTIVTLFNTVVIPSEWNQTHLEKMGAYTIEIVMQAVQFKNFENADEAFTALQAEVDGVEGINSGAPTLQSDYLQTVLTANLGNEASETSEDVAAPETSEEVAAPETSEEVAAPETSEDAAPETSEEVNP